MPWLTGDTIPTAKNCRIISIPDDPVFIQAVNGALLDLTYAENWEQHGDLTPDQQAEAFDNAYIEFSTSKCAMTPVGLIAFWLDDPVPEGWLWCDGGSWLKTEWPDLYEHWGDKYGETTDMFNLPDMRGRSPYGAMSDASLDLTAGSETHTLTIAEMPIHQHRIPKASATINAGVNTSTPAARTDNVAAPTMFTDTEGSGNAHNNLHPVYYGYWIVYAGKAG